MDRIFNMDNKFFTFMSRVADLIILNLLTLVLCVPVITIGPALTALFYLTMKMVRNEETYIVRGYFKSFKENFKQGLVLNLIMLAAGALLFLDFNVVSSMDSGMKRILLILLGFVLLVYGMVFVYLYPLQAKFYNTIKNTFTNALLMSLRHLPFTLLMIVITAAPAAAFLFGTGQVPSYVLLFSFLFGVSGIAFINSHFLVKIFDNYIPEEAKQASQVADDLEFRVAEPLTEGDTGAEKADGSEQA